MSLFCEFCDNLLHEITSADSFSFKCINCSKTYEPKPADTLRMEEVRGTKLLMFKNLLQTAATDPLNPKCFKQCKKCNNNIATRIQLGDDMKLINTCTKCEEKWLESIDE